MEVQYPPLQPGAAAEDQVVQERFVCPFAATAFVAGNDNKHFRQIWEDHHVASNVDTCSIIQRAEYVTIVLHGPKKGVTRALQKLSRCLMHYNPQRDPHNENYKGPAPKLFRPHNGPYRSSLQNRPMRGTYSRRAADARRSTRRVRSLSPTPPPDSSDVLDLHPHEPVDPELDNGEDGEIVCTN